MTYPDELNEFIAEGRHAWSATDLEGLQEVSGHTSLVLSKNETYLSPKLNVETYWKT